uniref:Uncharacterized protein n=1 Tax=Chrysotila carterae TaxID=13221 RepID=A0A7S4B8T7_CHRCT
MGPRGVLAVWGLFCCSLLAVCSMHLCFNIYASLPLSQSTLMLYDTSILRDTDMQEIDALFHRFGRIADGDQSILSLYFHNLRKVYRPLPYRLLETNEVPYDFSSRIRAARAGVDGASYVITAWRYGALSRPASACEPLWNKTVWRPQAKCEDMLSVRKGNAQ